MVQTPQGETTGRTAKAVRDRKEKELYESKVDFFTEIAHEVRTPLTLINGPLEAIEEMEIQEPKMKKYISVMVQNTKRLLELTGQLLDFQKIGANKLTMKFESVDITELLAGIVARFEVTFSLNRKELQLKSTDEQVWAAVDKEAITKILSNLLNNALKYASQNVLVELEREKTALRFVSPVMETRFRPKSANIYSNRSIRWTERRSPVME